jgi:hypothetical protein
LSLTIIACADESLDPFEELEAAGGKADGLVPLVDGTPRAVGVLRLVNDPDTSVAELDDDVPLDRRAALGIVDARPFDIADDLDAVPWVGAVALDRLGSYALAEGWVPQGADLLGTWDGVSFTVDQAEHALRLANEESDGVLRFEVGLSTRTVTEIIAARDGGAIESVMALAAVPWVGPQSLRALRDHNVPEPGDACRFDGDCPGSLQCVGFPEDGTGERGVCKDLSARPGDGAACDDEGDCSNGLVCAGLTVSDEGTCRPDWMAATFVATTTLHIPASTPQPIPGLLQVAGLANVPEDIAVTVDIAYERRSDLRIELRDPNGYVATVFDGEIDDPDRLDGPIPVLDNPRDDAVNGRWLLWIHNDGGHGTGTFRGWTLALTSRL